MVAVHEVDTPLFTFPGLKAIGTVKRNGPYSAMTFSPCGRYLAFTGPDYGEVQVWDVEAKPPKLDRLLRPTQKKTDPHFNANFHLGFSADGERILTMDGLPNLSYWEWKKDRRAKAEISFGGQLTWPGITGDGIVAGVTPKGGLRVLQVRKDGMKPVGMIPDAGLPSYDARYYVTPDGRVAVLWKGETEAIELHELREGGSRLLHKTTALAGQAPPGASLGVEDVAVSGDLSLLVVSYGTATRLIDECFTYLAFFPRTKERAAELGLDPKRHTYALLKVETGRHYEPPSIRFSPDGNWFFFVRCDFLDPIFWEVSRVGEILRADKRVERR